MSVEIKVTSDSRQANADLSRLEKSLGDIGKKASETSSKLNFKLLADDKDAQKVLKAFDKDAGKLFSSFKRAEKLKIGVDTTNAKSGLSSLRTDLEKTNSLAKALTTTLSTLFVAGTGASALKIASQFEVLNARLETITGSTVEAQQAFSKLEEFVKSTPYSLGALTDAYARLTATGNALFKTQSDVLGAIDALADSVAAVGGSSYNFTQVAIAFERMASEGRLTAERLNQITDAGIPLTRIAEKLGFSMAELRAESEAGTLSFNKFYKAFVLVAKGADGFGGAAARQADTLAGATSNLGDSIAMVADRMLRTSGITDRLVTKLQATEKAVNSFGEGIDTTIAVRLFAFDLFVIKLRYSLDKAERVISNFSSKVFNLLDINLDPITDKFKSFFKDFGQSAEKNVPTLKFDYIYRQLDELSGRVSEWQPRPINLKQFLPSLNQVMQVVSAFGKFVKDVFYDVWDAVVGNSYWPDTIEGIADWAGKLRTLAGDKIKQFVNFVKTSFSDLQDFLSLKFTVITNTPDVKHLVNTFKSLGKLVSDKVLEAANRAQSFFSSTKDRIQIQSEFKNAKSIREFFDNIQQRIEAISFDPLADSFNNLYQKLKIEQISNVITSAFSNSVNTLSNGNFWTKVFDVAVLLLLAKFNAGFRKLAILATGIKLAVELQDLLVTDVFTGAVDKLGQFIGRTIRDAITSNAEQGVIDLLFKITKVITNFGNSILTGAGIPEWANTSGGGLIVGILATTLTVAVLTNRLGKIASWFWGFLKYNFTRGDGPGLGRQIGEKIGTGLITGVTTVLAQLGTALSASLTTALTGAAGAGAAWTVLGSTLAHYAIVGFTAAFKLGGGFAGAFAGSFLADKIIQVAGIESETSKLATQIAVIFSTALVSAVLAEKIGFKLASIVFSASVWASASAAIVPLLRNVLVAAAISLGGLMAAGINTSFGLWIVGALASVTGFLASIPLLVTAAVVALGGGILYLLFGDEKGLAGKLRTVLGGWLDEFKKWAKDVGKEIITYIVPDVFKKKPGKDAGYVNEFSGQGFASGGKVRGSGTGTSDSIMARLSNGEFVINAEATKNNLGLLERINSGLPAFKDGGKVSLKEKLSNRFNELSGKVSSILRPKVIKETGPNVISNKTDDLNTLPGINDESFSDLIKKAKAQELQMISILNGVNSQWQPYIPLATSSGEAKPLGVRDLIVSRTNKGLGIPGDETKYEANPVLPKMTIPDLSDSITTSGQLKRGYAVVLHELGHLFDFATDMIGITTTGKALSKARGLTPGSIEESNLFTDLANNALSNKWGLNAAETAREGEATAWAMRNSILPPQYDVGQSLLFGMREYLMSDLRGKNHSSLFSTMKKGHLDYLDDGNINDSISNQLFDDIVKKKDIAALKRIAGYASGGNVLGPGTGTSDSILARLSNGEFVVNAAATAKNRNLLESINSGQIPRFNNGGIVSGRSTNPNDPRLIYRDKSAEQLLESAFKLENASEDLQKLSKAVLLQESNGRLNVPDSINGAVGAMQVMPDTFKSVADAGWEISDPLDNMRAGIRYLSKAMVATNNDLRKSAAYYYSGPGGVAKMEAGIAVRNPKRPTDPTQFEYADKVMARIGKGASSTPSQPFVPYQIGDTSLGQLDTKINVTESLLRESLRLSKGTNKLSVDNTPSVIAKARELLIGETGNLKASAYTGETTKERLAAATFIPFRDKIDIASIKNLDAFEKGLEESEEAVGIIAKLFNDFAKTGELNVNLLEATYTSLTRANKTLSKEALTGLRQSDRRLAQGGTRSDFAKSVGSEQSKGIRGDFQNALSSTLKGTNEEAFGRTLINSITGRVVDSFSSGITESLFGADGGLGKMFSNMFSGQADLGEGLGSFLGKGISPATEGLTSLLGEKGSTPANPLYTSEVPSIGAGASLTNVAKPESMLSGIFDKLKGGLSGMMDSVKGLFSNIDFGSIFSFFGFADGGKVSGPGTGTSDSIPAMLSNGEFVVKASSAKKYGTLLTMLNNNSLPRFAEGGLVGGTASPLSSKDLQTAAMNQPAQQMINVNITGDISRQTKSEIYKMLPSIAEGVNSHNREKGFRG